MLKIAAIVMSGMALAGVAHALEPKQCLPIAEINAALKADGQRSLIIGDRWALKNPTGKIKDAGVDKYINVVTSNDDGSLGYQLEGDLPREQKSTSMCVGARLTNIRLYDARKSGTPSEAFLGGRFDEMLRRNEKLGTRPMVQADTMHPTPDGWRIDLPMTLIGNTKERAAFIYSRLPDGQPQELLMMGHTDYTPYALEKLK